MLLSSFVAGPTEYFLGALMIYLVGIATPILLLRMRAENNGDGCFLNVILVSIILLVMLLFTMILF